MKSNYCTLFLFSSLILVVSSCADYVNPDHSARTENAQEQQLEESQIINIMMTVDKGEIDAAQEAIKKNASPPINQYANYLIQQHERNLEQLNHLTRQLKLSPKESNISNSLKTGSKQNLEKIIKLQGISFDKAFIDSMVKDHQDGLNLIDAKLIPQTNNPQLKVAVEQFRVMVSEHLEKAREIQRKL